MLCFVIVAIIDMLQFSGATRWHTTTQLAPSCSQRHAVLAKKEMFVEL